MIYFLLGVWLVVYLLVIHTCLLLADLVRTPVRWGKMLPLGAIWFITFPLLLLFPSLRERVAGW